jgi:hypothetical protein
MSVSTIVVAVNAMLLRRLDLQPAGVVVDSSVAQPAEEVAPSGH